MKVVEPIVKIANKIIMLIMIIFASIMFLFSLYVLYDVFYTNRNAFTSYDLLQYRPKIEETESDNNIGSFEELKRINPDFNDWYNLIYGHHMDNGAMFGDIDKYRDKDFFNSHQKGVLQTPVLTVLGHISDEHHWAFLNLVCVIITVLILCPLLFLRKKYRQLPYSKRKAKELKDYEIQHDQKIRRDLRRFVMKMRIGIILEILIATAAVIMFLLTENITKSVVIRDKWTGIMILTAYLALLADYICFRYRGERPENTSD